MEDIKFKFLISCLILCLLLLPNELPAQPQVESILTYGGIAREIFYDIFAVSDGGYVMCGVSTFEQHVRRPGNIIIVRIDSDLNTIWYREYESEDLAYAFSIVETEEGGFMIAGSLDGVAHAWNLDSEGEVIWQNQYNASHWKAVIELKAGEFLFGGYGLNLTSINQEGEVNWSEFYDPARGGEFNGIRETEGGIVASGRGRDNGGTNQVYVIKVNFEGELIWSRLHGNVNPAYSSYGIVSANEGGFALTGWTRPIRDRGPPYFYLMKIRDDGQQTRFRIYEESPGECIAIDRMREGGYVLAGFRRDQGPDSPKLTRTSSAGVVRWDIVYDLGEDERFTNGHNRFYSVVRGHDNSILAVGFVNMAIDSLGTNALLIKVAPEILEPIILRYAPEDTVFNVLLGDSVQFIAFAEDQQGDQLSNLWITNDDTLGNDTTETVTFEDLGEYLVQCQISDGEFTSTIRWHVTSEEFFIDFYTPDSLSWTIRRPHEVDFELGVRAMEGIEPQYRWILTGHRGAREDVGDASNLTYEFDRPGEYSLEGRAFLEGVEQSIHWRIAVNSVLYWWTPHERELTVDQHDEVEFNLLPFNPNSDSLDFRWLIDGELDENELDAGLFYSFGDLGDHTVTAIVHDGAEVDTVVWSITVEDPNAVEDSMDDLFPTEVTLYPAAPNPFNSTTRVRYFLPRSTDVLLTAYDSAGRLVQTLHDDMTVAGEHRATLHGSEFPAGVYLLRLDTGSVVRSIKVVLLK